MKGKYFFNGEDITIDILFKIEHIVNIMAEKENIPFDDAYFAFLSSNTYAILKRTDNLYWGESAEFLADEYYREISSKSHSKTFVLVTDPEILAPQQ